MRPSKSRSRAKSNRRPTGNIVNRVFDSSGPEGKVRGTPQQIIDKYLALARDATLANDRVAAENFHQHAEHYTRLLGEALREAETRREQHEAQFRRERGPYEGQESGEDDRHTRDAETGQNPGGEAGGGSAQGFEDDTSGVSRRGPAGEVIESDTDTDSGLVETPESQPGLRRGGRRRSSGARTAGPEQEPAGTDADDVPPASAAE